MPASRPRSPAKSTAWQDYGRGRTRPERHRAPPKRAATRALTRRRKIFTVPRLFPPAQGKLPQPRGQLERFDMTFTEAAVEVLRRAGKPLHYKDIAAVAKRDDDRKVLAVAPEGTFALVEWSVPPEQVVEPVAPPLHPAEDEATLYRPREREPRPINAQARR